MKKQLTHTKSNKNIFKEEMLKDLVLSLRKNEEDQETINSLSLAVEEFIDNQNPKDEIEVMALAQLLVLNSFTMRSIGVANKYPLSSAASNTIKLSRGFSLMLDSLMNYRNRQTTVNNITVENVDVHNGGQAIVGNVYKK